MLRKPFVALLLILVGLLFLLLLTSSGLAAPAAQGENPGERLRPDQYSYHGMEDIPFTLSQTPPEVQEMQINSPVESWSKMVFESYVDGASWELYYASGSFTNLVRLTSNNTPDIHPRLNRGCTRIAFASYRDGTDYEIYTMNTDGSSPVRLTNNSADDVKPVWSPNGTKIAFQSYRDGLAEVYVMNADGSGQTRLTYSVDYSGEPTWSPDGSHIAFATYRNSLWRIWVMDANGTNQHQISQQAYSELPIWSPDGSQIVYDADADYDDMQELWVMNADGSNQTMKVDGGTGYLYGHTIWANGWSPDQSFMTYTDVELINYQGAWYWDYAWLYKLDQNGFSYYINPGRLSDWNLDWTTADNQPPSTSMSVPASSTPYQFTVSWSGRDSVSGLLNYDVQVRDGSGGAWTNWQLGTTATSATYTGVGGHDYYFRIRARDKAFNVQAWPANYQAHVRVESAPPTTLLHPLDAFTRGTQVTLSWEGDDPGGSGIYGYDVPVMDDAVGVWQDWLTNTTETSSVFSGELGHTYHFRLRGTDNALNVEAWTPGIGDATTTLFSWLAAGTSRDNTGVPVAGMDISIDPEAFLTYPSDLDGNYSAYLATDPAVKTITWSKGEYGALPATDYGLPDANVDVYLPPADNVVQDFGFESGILPGAWQTGGDFSPTMDSINYHSGDCAASLGITLEKSAYSLESRPPSQSGDSWLSQSLTLPVSMTNPTLSFLASLSGVSEVSGNEFLVQVSNNISTTTMLTSTTPTAWEHFWFDMTPWSGQEITLTFQVTENAGFQPASALLDEVTLGAAHADAWVELSEGALYAHPGEQFTFQLDYGNRSGIPATVSVITMTLPTGLNFVSATVTPDVVGNQLVWPLADLPPGSVFAPIYITVEVNQSAPLLQSVETNVEITTTAPELELLNNKSQFETFLAYPAFLPIAQK